MAYNGAGVFNRLYSWVTDAANSIKISSTRTDAETDGIATGLSTCITKDGQTTVTANIPLGGFRITNIGDATARTDAAKVSQVQNSSSHLVGSISGTNTITGSLTPVLTAYTSGQKFHFVVANTNTGATTLNIDSVGAKNITLPTTVALAGGELVAGSVAVVEYDGTQFQLVGPGMLLGKHTIPILASSMVSRTTNGAAAGLTELATNDIMLATKDFDQTTAEYAQFTVPMPKAWNEGTVTVQFGWTAASGTGDVVWAVAARAFSDDDALDQAAGGDVTVTDTLIAANDLHITSVTSAMTIAGTPAEGDMVIFVVYRDAAVGGDTLNADAKLLWVKVFTTYSAANDA